MVLDHDERKILEDLILSKLVLQTKLPQGVALKKVNGYPVVDSIGKKMVPCAWESDILGKLLDKLS